MVLDTRDIQKIIPHRYPFLLIDRVLEVIPDEKLVAIKNVSVNEQFFVGHFPKEKVMPGVLIVEAIAQAACILFHYTKNKEEKELIYYLAKSTAKFIKPVTPGDQLRIEVFPVKLLARVGFMRGIVYVGEDKVCEAEIGFGIKEV